MEFVAPTIFLHPKIPANLEKNKTDVISALHFSAEMRGKAGKEQETGILLKRSLGSA